MWKYKCRYSIGDIITIDLGRCTISAIVRKAHLVYDWDHSRMIFYTVLGGNGIEYLIQSDKISNYVEV